MRESKFLRSVRLQCARQNKNVRSALFLEGLGRKGHGFRENRNLRASSSTACNKRIFSVCTTFPYFPRVSIVSRDGILLVERSGMLRKTM